MDNSNYKIHLRYWAVLFVVLTIFLILCVPGKINEDAFSNFSFASVLVSIVLAVISIVLSIFVSQSTNQYYSGIRDIEKDIDTKLSNFDKLENSIRNSVQGIIQEEVKDVKENQNKLNLMLGSFLTSKNKSQPLSSPKDKGDGDRINLSSSPYSVIASLYLACLMYENSSPFPFESFSSGVSALLLGSLGAFHAVFPDSLDYTIGDDKNLRITSFSTEKWGDSKQLKAIVDRIDNQAIKDSVIKAEEQILGNK